MQLVPDIQDEPDIVNTILLYRIYDVLSVMLSNISPTDWEAVMQAHEQGLFVTPLPSILVEPEETDDGLS